MNYRQLKSIQSKVKIRNEIASESWNTIKFVKHARNATLLSVLFNELYDIPDPSLKSFQKF